MPSAATEVGAQLRARANTHQVKAFDQRLRAGDLQVEEKDGPNIYPDAPCMEYLTTWGTLWK